MGHAVWVLSRSPESARLPEGVQARGWDGKTGAGWTDLLEGADAVINLAGANIGARPWSNARKRLIRTSRVEAGQAVVDALRGCTLRPRVVLQIAGVGYYGTARGSTVFDESAPRGLDFLSDVSEDWENAIRPVEELDARLSILRTGVVLTNRGGVLAPFVLQNRLFAGGPLGSGDQWISWIHIRDLVRVFLFMLDRPDAAGVFNATAPDARTNRDFGKAVSQAMGRPFWLPAPAVALRAALGEMSTLVLDGQRVAPARLQQLGFEFEFDTLEKALNDLLATEK
jgi:uncharacterized protein (TIGR01777 family)